MSEKDGTAIYGAWVTMVQCAQKMPLRGVLADASGPLDAEDLADKTMVPQKVIERMLQVTSSERIGWARLVTDPDETASILREVAGVPGDSRRKRDTSRESPAIPDDSRRNGGTLREKGASPADCGDSRESPAIPGNSRESSGIPDKCRTSRARGRTGPDHTVPYHTDPLTPSLSPLSETAHFVLGIFGKKRNRLSTAAEHELSRHAGDLPLSSDQKNLLAWFYGIPPDPEDFDLRGRHGDADKLALNLFGSIERAESYAKKIGVPLSSKKSAAQVPASEPAGCWDWYAAAYPGQERPASWAALPESVRSEFNLRGRKS